MNNSDDFPQVTEQARAHRKLCNTIQFIDALSQEGFSQIAAIAGLMKDAIETGRTQNQAALLEKLYHSADAIREKAQKIDSCIKSEAESVGCSYVGKLSKITRNEMGVQ